MPLKLSSIPAALTSSKGLALLAFAVIATVALLLIGGTGSDQSRLGLSQAAQSPTAPSTGAFSVEQEAAIGEIVKAYLLRNPQVLMEAGQAFEQQQRERQAEVAKRVIAENKTEIFKSPQDFVFGNPKGDISVVEFFDYNCGWCKRSLEEIVKLTKADPKVRVVMKEFPVFGGPPSLEAAKAAMASRKQDKYWDFHVALMKARQVSPENLYVIAAQVGLDVQKLKADMADPKIEAALHQNVEIGRKVGIEATPGFLVDSHLNVGYLQSNEMQGLLAEIRKTGCQAC